MNERDRQRAIQLKLARSEAKRVSRIVTGFEALDRALEGGVPRGRITEISGGSGSGKTTFALLVAGNLQRNGLSAAWIDVERAFDAAYAMNLGVSLEPTPCRSGGYRGRGARNRAATRGIGSSRPVGAGFRSCLNARARTRDRRR